MKNTLENFDPAIYQVLLLNNDINQEVKVHEAKKVDFNQVKQHLNNGGSVFITSKNMQKIANSKPAKAQQNYAKSRKNIGWLLRHHLR